MATTDLERLELDAGRKRLAVLAFIASNPTLSEAWAELCAAEDKVLDARRDARERGE